VSPDPGWYNFTDEACRLPQPSTTYLPTASWWLMMIQTGRTSLKAVALTSTLIRRSRCSRSSPFPLVWDLDNDPRTASWCDSSLSLATSALAAAALLQASALSAAALASFSIASARTALAAAVAVADAASTAESDAEWRQRRLHPRNRRDLSLSAQSREICGWHRKNIDPTLGVGDIKSTACWTRCGFAWTLRQCATKLLHEILLHRVSNVNARSRLETLSVAGLFRCSHQHLHPTQTVLPHQPLCVVNPTLQLSL